MSFTYGFYNSLNGDRKYNAEQMAAVFDCLINDGVQQNIGDKLMVKTSADALTVSVGSGRAWFNSTWSYNDSDYPFLLNSVGTTGYSRIDAICLVVDKNVATRKNFLTVVEGTAGTSPAKPPIPTAANRFYHVLGYVTVKNGDSTIPVTQIENRVGTTDCPFITGILQTVTVDELLRQWRGEFDMWWENIKTILNDNVAANLQNQIDHLSVKEATMNLYGLSNIPTNTAATKKYAEYAVDAVMNKLAVTTTTGGKFSVNPQSHATPLDAILNQISILFNNVNTIVSGLTINIANSTSGSKALGNNGSSDADVESGEVANFGFNLGGGCIVILAADTISSNSRGYMQRSYLMFKNNKMFSITDTTTGVISNRTTLETVSYPIAVRINTVNKGYGGANVYQNRFAWINYRPGAYTSMTYYYEVIKLKYD